MQVGYFKTAWNDIKNSPGWKSKMFLMALIMLGSYIIPVIGPILGAIVINGYLYGWARDAAWGVQSPLPKRIFGNEDGKLYSRGFFVSVLSFVFALIPSIFYVIYLIFSVTGTAGLISSGNYSSFEIGAGGLMTAGVGGLIFYLLYIVAMLVVNFFIWVGSMRISIYGRLSAGFQLKKIWAMIRHDTGGILRIFGMSLLVGLIAGAIIAFAALVLFGIVFVIALAVGGNSIGSSYGSIDGAILGMIVSVIGIAIVFFLAFLYFALVVSVWTETLIARALGYWVRQFDVPSWRGQDDPMPFELQQSAPPAGQGGQYAQGYGQPYQQQTPSADQPSTYQPVQQTPPPTGQPLYQSVPPYQSEQAAPEGQPLSQPVQQAPSQGQAAPVSVPTEPNPQQEPSAVVAQPEISVAPMPQPAASDQGEQVAPADESGQAPPQGSGQ